MKSSKFYALITFLTLSLCNRVQTRPQELFTKKESQNNVFNAVENRELPLNNLKQIVRTDDFLLAPLISENLESPSDIVKTLDLLPATKISKDFATKFPKLQNFLKSAKSHYPKSEPTNENKAFKIPENEPKIGTVILISEDSKKIYCRQIMNSEPYKKSDEINSLQHICEPPTKKPLTSLYTPRSLLKKESNIEHILIFTPAKGLNCRRFMNSEVNNKGQIVDSVWDVCETPTTTTTTTRRPITTTRRVITTTPKPKVKVCRPHMNSYVNEEGQIVDGVTVVCKMEEVK